MTDIGVDFTQPFSKQVAFFRAKLGNQVTTEKWTDMLGMAHDRAFTVAGATKADLLADLAKAVDQALNEGGSLQSFQADFDKIVDKHGWQYKGERNWRTLTIYRTNLLTSHAAGRLAQLQQADYPHWMYRHSGSANPRHQHKAWHGLILPADDAFWRTHYPPNGFGCGCRAIGIRNAADAKRYGGRFGSAPPIEIDPTTGAPQGIGKGWDYMPGDDSDMLRALREKEKRWPKPLLDAFKRDMARKKPPFWDSSTPAGQWHDEAFSQAPDYIKRTIKRVGDPPRVLATPNTIAHMYPGKHIEMDGEQRGSRLGNAIWRHEYGHWVDYRLGKSSYWSAGKGFSEAMASDAKTLLKHKGRLTDERLERLREGLLGVPSEQRQAWVESLAKKAKVNYEGLSGWLSGTVVNELQSNSLVRYLREAQVIEAMRLKDAQAFLDAIELKNKDDITATAQARALAHNNGQGNISDLFSAATLREIEGCAGHTKEYYAQWRNGAGQKAEAFANLFDLVSEPQFGEVIARKFTPKMLSSIKRLLK